MDKLLEFDITEQNTQHHFIINADNFNLDFDGTYMDVDQDGFELLRVQDGSAQPFVPQAVTWAGHHITQEDAMMQSICGFLNDNPKYNFSYVAPELEAFKEANMKTACSVNGRDVSDKYFSASDECAYDLLLVTDQSIYYSYDDSAVMLSARDGSLISNNYFAEEGFMSSIEDILQGNEQEVYAPVDLSEVKQSVADELGIDIDTERESVNTSLVDMSGEELEPTNEYV